jgi:hypothetical protein
MAGFGAAAATERKKPLQEQPWKREFRGGNRKQSKAEQSREGKGREIFCSSGSRVVASKQSLWRACGRMEGRKLVYRPSMSVQVQ